MSPTTAEHVLADLNGRINGVLDGGPCEIGVESTVLDLTATSPRILRKGSITREQLQRILTNVEVANANAVFRRRERLPSPGMMSRHYAPRTKLVLIDGREEALARAAQESSEQKVGALLPSGWNIRAAAGFDWGRWGDWSALASRLYAGLRWLDEEKIDLIIAPLPPEEGLASAIRERLFKASSRAEL